MSTSTQAMPAQVFAGLRSVRGSVGSSPTETVPPHATLREMLVLFGLPVSTTIRQLYDLLLELDDECLRHATGQDLNSDAKTVVDWALYLSGSLCQFGGNPGAYVFQEVQLRALVSSLALLQHKEVHSLNPDVYDRLSLKNISARFQDIVFGVQPTSRLADRIRHAPSVYLVQVAAQYASFIKRGNSPLTSIFVPTVDIIFAALSVGGGGYHHIRDIIVGINQFVNIWQKPQKKYRALCGLQEYTRLATSLCRDSAIADESGESRTAAAAIVTALVDELDKILATENGQSPPELSRRWHRPRAVMWRKPPDLDHGYYYYGLLDCVSQLATVSDRHMLGGLLDRVKDLIFNSVVPEFRWKAIEIALSCHGTRLDQYRILERDINTRATIESKVTIREEMQLIHMQLENDEEDCLRFRVSRPLTRLSQDSVGPDSGLSSSPSSQTISPCPREPPFNEFVVSRPESAFARSLRKDSTTFSLSSVPKFGKSYHSSGLFKDCTRAFFNNDSEISIYELGNLQKRPPSPRFSKVFSQEFEQRRNQEFIRTVSSSQSYIFIVTNRRLIIVNLDTGTSIDTTLHGEWDPSGLACHESETHVIVFLGLQQRAGSEGFNGQIKVHRYRKASQGEELPVFFLDVPANDCPKRLSFDADSQILTCITRLRNKLLVWKLGDEFSSSADYFEFCNNYSTAENRETGLTSATIYRSPSNRLYVLCTSAPSSERYRHRGEWSFILPVTSNAFESHIHSGSGLHAFARLKDHRPILAGCPSSQHNIFAILENSGRLSILQLVTHGDGGIDIADKDVELPAYSLCKQDRPLTDCVRFDPSGSYLFAVDRKGKIMVTEFENV